MSKDAAAADLQAAAYWRSVARTDRADTTAATAKASELTTAAQREEKEPPLRRTRGMRAG